MHTTTGQATAPSDSTAHTAAHPWRWRVLAVVLLAEVMDLLDSTVMNVAAPAVRAGIGGGEATLQWLSAAYTLAFGVLLVVGGRLGDRCGRRRLFVLGAAGFALASLVCGLAPTTGVLIAARIAQGAFGALLIPQGFGMLVEVFDVRERGRAFSLFGPVMGLSAVGGPILAGALVGLDAGGLGWRLIFLINLPLGLAAVLGAMAWMPRTPGDSTARLDPVGAVLVAVGSALLVHPLIQGREAGWPWWTAAELVGSAVAFAALARRQRTAASPILVPSLLRNRVFVSGLVTAVAFFAGVGGLMLVASLYLQLGRGTSPLATGLTLAPLALGIALSSLAVPRLTARLGRGVLHLGLAVETIGVLALAAVTAMGAAGRTVTSAVAALAPSTSPVAALAPSTSPVAALAPFGATALVIGLGMGMMFGPLIQNILAGAAPDEVGSASGVLNAVQQVATALGVAALGTVFFAVDAGTYGLVTSALAVAAGSVLCAVLVLRLPRTLSLSHSA